MKTLSILFTTLLLTAQLCSAQETDREGNVPSIQQKIQRSVHVPSSLLDQNGDVRVRVVFAIDETGNVRIIEINTSNKNIVEDVRRQFENMNFSGEHYELSKEYSIWLTFRVL